MTYRPSCIALALALLSGSAIADRPYNSDTTATHDCTKNPEVSINTSNTVLTLTGTCDKLSANGSNLKITAEAIRNVSINGSGNTVELGGVDKLAVNGAGNTVTYKRAISGGKVKIANLGANNKITRAK
jgi:hypothetical protein